MMPVHRKPIWVLFWTKQWPLKIVNKCVHTQLYKPLRLFDWSMASTPLLKQSEWSLSTASNFASQKYRKGELLLSLPKAFPLSCSGGTCAVK
jgi:hypothetical protein